METEKQEAGTGRLIARLVAKGLKYRLYKYGNATPPLEALSLEITRRCVARCVMCNIWKTPASSPELSLPALTGLLSSPGLRALKELDITGGEPFLREDLADLLTTICSLKARHFPALCSVAVTSNGFLTDRILDVSRRVVPLMKNSGIDLIIVFAMDAIGSLHDTIRRVPKGWPKLDASIQGMKAMRESHGNVIIGLKTTVLPVNVGELEGIAGYAEKNGLFTIISPCIITGNRYGNTDLEENLRFSPEDIRRVLQFYKSPRFMWGFHRDLLVRFFEKGETVKPCSAGFNYFFMRSTGELFPCPLIKESLGTYPDSSFDDLIRTGKARAFRRKVGSFRECRSCTEPGLERYALPFEGFHYLRMFLKTGKKGFLDLHRHMGLDKYV